MRFNLLINFADGSEKEITASTPDLVAFEDKFNISVGKLATEQRLGHLLFLAWHSEKRRKATDLGYDAWLETVDSVGESKSDPK
jgi:hypothetical protein